MAFVCAVDHAENSILADRELNTKSSLFDERGTAYHLTKLFRGGNAGYSAGYLGEARAVTSGKNDCTSVLILLGYLHGKHFFLLDRTTGLAGARQYSATSRACSRGINFSQNFLSSWPRGEN